MANCLWAVSSFRHHIVSAEAFCQANRGINATIHLQIKEILRFIPFFIAFLCLFFLEWHTENLAEFIRQAHDDGLDIICQCEYGQSRSAACAAAILEHYCKNGISVFADYRYYPNQLVYNKIKNALDLIDKE